MSGWRIDLVSLDLFLIVAAEGSIAAAAARRNIAASAVSRRVQELELAADTPLLQRHARGVTLTPAGEALQRHALSVFGLLSRIRDDMGAYAQGARGQIRIATNSSALIEFLPEELARFAAAYPGIRMDVQEQVSPDIVRLVRDGLSDLGILAADHPCEGLEVLPYRGDQLCAVLPDRHALASESGLWFAQMLDYPQVGLQEGSSIQQMLITAARQMRREIDLRIRVGSFDAVRRLVQVGLGLAVLPEACVTPYRAALDLAAIPLRDPWAQRAMQICVRDLRTLPAPARLFIEQIATAPGSA